MRAHATAVLEDACPACGGTAWRPAQHELVACEACALVCDTAVWSGASYAERITDDAFGDDFVGRIDRWQQRFEAAIARRTWRRIAPHLPAHPQWLEVGVGSGTLLAYAAGRGASVSGCDLSAAVCRHVRATHGVAMVHGPVSALPVAACFDVVVMNHVLEHTGDPVAVLQQIRSRLRPGGIVHIAVPNVASWNARFAGWTSYVPYHLVYFTPDTLRRAVEQAGLTVVKAETCEPFSGWFLTLLRSVLGAANTSRSQRHSRGADGSVSRALYRAAMVLFGTMTAPLRMLQAWLGRGEELIVVAKAAAR